MMQIYPLITTIIPGLMLLFLPVTSQEKGALITDRPDQTESAVTVPRKYVQIETGVIYEQENSELTNFTYNTTLIRFGILDNMELRFGGEYLGINDEINEYKVHGLAPVTLGTKIQIAEDTRLFDALGMIAHLQLPKLSSPGFEARNLAPVILLAASNDLSDKLSLGYNAGVEWDGFSRAANGIFSLALGYGLTAEWSVFTEIYGNLPEGGQKADLRVDAGITYLAIHNLQFDLAGGIGLNEAAPDFYLGTGFSLRMPN